MALSKLTVARTRASVAAAGTSVAPGLALPDNCHTVIFLNRSATQVILIGNGVAGGALPDDGTTTALPAAASLTWELGVIGERVTALTDLIFDTIGLAAANCDIPYLCAPRTGPAQ